MAKKHKGLMGRSDIPFAQRMRMQRDAEIVDNRNHAAQIAMFCNAAALNEVEGIGYKRLVSYSLRHKKYIDEFYEDPIAGMEHAKRRMEYMGMPISGNLFTIPDTNGMSKKEAEIGNHRLQASQIALICGAMAMNDEFGFAAIRQQRVTEKGKEYSARYAREGEGFLLEKMAKIGFRVENGQVRAYLDDDGKPVTPKQAKKLGGNYADNQD
jgi:hypothetical protein